MSAMKRAVHVDLQVPADIRQARRERDHLIERGGLVQMAHEIEAHAAKAAPVETAQLGIAHRDRQQRHAEIGTALGRERVLGHAVVHAVRGGLHDHATLDPEQGVQREQRLLRRIGRVDRRGRRERIFVRRAEHMAVGVP